jgi:hypothetical protein
VGSLLCGDLQEELISLSQGSHHISAPSPLRALLSQADSEGALLGRDHNLVFARQPSNGPVEGGFLPLLPLSDGLHTNTRSRLNSIPRGQPSLWLSLVTCNAVPHSGGTFIGSKKEEL